MAPLRSRREKPDFANYRSTRRPTPSTNPTSFLRVNTYFEKHRDFLLSALDFSDEDETWEPARMLGAGSFGSVGLWRKIDEFGNMADEIAVKEERHTSSNREPHPATHEGLTREAVVQAQANTHGSETIVHLRRYKYYPGYFATTAGGKATGTVGAGEGKYRSFLEFCPHGTLFDLARRYNAWDQYLPEPFIWHVFTSLAEAAVALKMGPYTDIFSKANYPDDFGILHFDIKPQNIFLGPEGEADPEADFSPTSYPRIMLSDFGLARITGPADANNLAKYWWLTTSNYRPLEHFHEPKIFGSNWGRAVNGRQRPTDTEELKAWRADPGFQFSSAHNVGSIGKCMYDLLTLSGSPDFYLASYTRSRGQYEADGEEALAEISVQVDGIEIYSRELRDLVLRCNRPSAAARINAEDLYTAASQGQERAVRSVYLRKAQRAPDGRAGGLPEETVFYAKNEINAMPRGRAGKMATESVWNRITNHDWMEPEWGALKPPEEKWRDMIQANRGKASGNMYRLLGDLEIDVDVEGKMFFVPMAVAAAAASAGGGAVGGTALPVPALAGGGGGNTIVAGPSDPGVEDGGGTAVGGSSLNVREGDGPGERTAVQVGGNAGGSIP